MIYQVSKLRVAPLADSPKLQLTLHGLIGPGIEVPLHFHLTPAQAQELVQQLTQVIAHVS